MLSPIQNVQAGISTNKSNKNAIFLQLHLSKSHKASWSYNKLLQHTLKKEI